MSNYKLGVRIPWRIVSRVVLTQISISFCLFTTLGILSRIYFKTTIVYQIGIEPSSSTLTQILKAFDSSLVFLLSGIFLLLLIFAMVLTNHLIAPIRRMLAKARKVLNRDSSL